MYFFKANLIRKIKALVNDLLKWATEDKTL